MKTNSEIRAVAREELKGNWTNPVLATLIYVAIISGISTITNTGTILNYPSVKFSLMGGLLNFFVQIPLALAFAVALLLFIRGDKQNVINNMFKIFANYGRTLSVSLLTAIFTFLWTLLLIIPGIIKGYAYAMTYYIAQDNPELGADECINKSMALMNGHKMDLFLLDLSFIGWLLLSVLSCGIGLLWVMPYIQTSHAIFYQELITMNGEDIPTNEEYVSKDDEPIAQ